MIKVTDEMVDVSDLKLCPFCGGEPEYCTETESDDVEFPHSVECSECHAATDSYPDVDSATEAWNGRTDIEAALSVPVPAQEADPVNILEWKNNEARSAGGHLYEVKALSTLVHQLRWNGVAFPGWYSSIEQAKAAAQAHCDAVDPLHPTPAHSGEREALERIKEKASLGVSYGLLADGICEEILGIVNAALEAKP